MLVVIGLMVALAQADLPTTPSHSLAERVAAVGEVRDCLALHAKAVAASPDIDTRIAALRALCRSEEAADLATSVRWMAGDSPLAAAAVGAATERSHRDMAAEILKAP